MQGELYRIREKPAVKMDGAKRMHFSRVLQETLMQKVNM